VPGSLEEFRADLLALVDRVDEDAVRRGLPERLVPGGDVLRMTRTVRLLGEVRLPAEASAQSARGMGHEGGDRGRAYAPAAESGDHGEEPPQPWEQVAAAHGRVVVLGDPGMGKSWLLRSEAHRLAAAARQDLAGPVDGMDRVLVPVVLRAGVLAGLPGRTLAEAVSGYLVAEGLLPARSGGRMRERITSGGVVVLVDALDEVPARGSGQGSLQRVAGLLWQWAESCTGTARCVVTSRLAGYAGPPVPGAREAELLPFEPQDVRHAAEAWDLPGRAAAQLREWLAQPAVAAMARIPLLLALLCSLAADPGRRQPSPRTRTELYGAVLWQFLSSAHRSGGPGGTGEAAGEVDRQALLAALTRVALTFADTGQGWVDQMPYRDLVEALRVAGDGLSSLGEPPAVALERLVTQAGVLVPAGSPAAGEQDYLFLHRTIAEYILARHLAGLPAESRMRVVTAHQWFDPDWAEVIPMLGTLLATRNLPEAQALVTHFLTAKPDPLHRAFDTAVRIICEAPDAGRLLTPATSQELHRRLRRLAKDAPFRHRLIRTLDAAPAWPEAITSAMLGTGSSTQLRQAAARALEGREGAEATRALLALAADSSPGVREEAARALAKREGAEAVSALLTLAADRDKYVREGAARALARREGSEETGALLTLAADSDREVRRSAAWALADREGAEDTGPLLTIAASSDENARRAAARALAKREGAEATGALLALAADSDGLVVMLAAWALADREGAEVAGALLTLAASSDEDVRLSAARALARREGSEETGALLTLAADSDREVRRSAAWALADREGAEAISALRSLATSSDRHVRALAAGALKGRERAGVTSALFTLAASSDGHVRYAAAKVLAKREGSEVTAALLALTTSSDKYVRASAAGALNSREGPEVTAALLTLATDNYQDVRASAAAALEGREGAEVTAALLTLATDNYYGARHAAAHALAGRRDPTILDRLCRRWRIFELPALRQERRLLAHQVVDQLYVLLPPEARPRILRHLGRLTR
jgi:HEAT repeat protein